MTVRICPLQASQLHQNKNKRLISPTHFLINRITEEMEAEIPGPHPLDLRSVFWNRGTTSIEDTGERYHISDRSHKTPNAMTTHELSIVMSKKRKREIRLKRSLKDPDTKYPGPSIIELSAAISPPSTWLTRQMNTQTNIVKTNIDKEREFRFRRSMKDRYKPDRSKPGGSSVICNLNNEEDDPPPRMYPYTDKMDNT